MTIDHNNKNTYFKGKFPSVFSFQDNIWAMLCSINQRPFYFLRQFRRMRLKLKRMVSNFSYCPKNLIYIELRLDVLPLDSFLRNSSPQETCLTEHTHQKKIGKFQ